MGEFVNFITKGIEIEKNDERRIFSGHISAEVVDHQNDFIFIKEILAIMDTFMKVLPVVSEVHTNRMVGKVLGYEKSQIDGHDSVKVSMEIFKQEGVTLYDQVWKKIKSGEYSGLSMGGGSKIREPMFKDGRYVMNLRNLELYEIAVCPSPANPLALIDKYNEFAKSDIMSGKSHVIDNRNIVQCSSISCEFTKGLDKDNDIDIDKEQSEDNKIEKTDEELLEDTRRPDDEKKLKPFDKPENPEDEKKDNINASNSNHNVYKQLSERNINNMTNNDNETKTEEIRKENPDVKVDSMATVVTDLIKTKDSLILEKANKIAELEKAIEGLKKTHNANPVDKGIESEAMPKATDSDDVGDKTDAKNDIAPKPSDSQASIIAPAVKEPGKDTAGLSMENKAEEDESKKEEKKEEIKKSHSIYKVVETVRPIIKSRGSYSDIPSAYQMLKAVEGGFGETRDADRALVLMHEKMARGEFGDGRPSGGVY